MSEIKFKIAAKSNVGMVRDNNEDSFQAASDLSVKPMTWDNTERTLGKKGALLVVADGMGGMNAGEVASEIAINTMRDRFSPETITDEVVKTRYTIERFMKNAIVEADNRIKDTAKERPETHGMGTTIVVGWVFDKHLYVAWCGDSRAYIFNPAYGIRQITKDHSYVQRLVDEGKIAPEDAFDYPDSNIITRCLSDSATKARPDCLVMPHELCDGDVVLLCTDGLSGLIHDYEIEEAIRKNYQNMEQCTDALINAACEAGGHDNITVVLCKILSGGAVASAESMKQKIAIEEKAEKKGEAKSRLKKIGLYSVAFLLALALIGAGSYFARTIFSKDRTYEEKAITAKGMQNPETSDKTLESMKDSLDKYKRMVEELLKRTESEESVKNKQQEKRKPSISIPVNKKDNPPTESIVNVTPIQEETDDANDAENEMETEDYEVQSGESLSIIAQKLGTTVDIIRTLNDKLKDNDNIDAGEIIKVPKKKR